MHDLFNYVVVSEDLVNRLQTHLLRNESIVVLGYPNSGKEYICRKLQERCFDIKDSIVYVSFAEGETIDSEWLIVERLAEAVGTGTLESCPSEGSLLAPLRAIRSERPILFIGDVDRLAYHVGRALLQEIRSSVEEGRLIAVITGEYDLQELVHGPNSAFTAAHQYVVQGFDENEFSSLLHRHIETSPISLVRENDVERLLFRLTRGNGDALWSLLKVLNEHRFQMGPGCSPLGPDDIEFLISHNPTVRTKLYHNLMRHAVKLIPSEPSSWMALEKLLAGDEVKLRQPSGAPGVLSLSGIARRNGATMEIDNPLTQLAARWHYNAQSLGDLYASVGSWEIACNYYRQTRVSGVRPISALDRRPTEQLLRAMRAKLSELTYQPRQQTTDPSASIRALIAEFCRYSIHVPEVLFFRKASAWEHIQLDEVPPPSKEAINAGREILSVNQSSSTTELKIPYPWKLAVVGVRLKGAWKDQPFALIMGDFVSLRVLSQIQDQCLQEVLRVAADAHNAVIEQARNRMLLLFRTTFEELASEILYALGATILDVHGVLRLAAERIRKLGYRRAFFSLVDSRRENIRGVLDNAPSSTADLSPRTNWPLSAPNADVQPMVVALGRAVLVSDARSHPWTCKESVSAAGTISCAIIPLLAHGEVVGTLHIEREDGCEISSEEAAEFEEFGRVLSAAILQSERIASLQSALNKIPSPLIVGDARGRVRYCNTPAEKLFSGLVGGRWRTSLDHVQDKWLQRVLDSGLSGRVFEFVSGLGNRSDFRGWVSADRIPDETRVGETVGTVVHVEDLNYVYRVFDTLAMVGSAVDLDSAIDRILDAIKSLGHRWARLYLIEHRPEGDRLVGRCQFDVVSGSIDSHSFAGSVVPASRSETSASWSCFVSRKPVVLGYGDEGRGHTALGLDVQYVSRPSVDGIAARHQGDYWIDFPLIAGDGDIGKISFECTEDLRPEHFRFLDVLCSMCRIILSSFEFREQAVRIREMEAEKALAQFAHTVATRWAFFRPAASLYAALSTDPKLQEVNRLVEAGVDEFDAIITRAKKNLRGIRLQLASVDLHVLLAELAVQIPELVYECPSPFRLVADPRELRVALEELIGNSLKAQANTTQKAVRISVATSQKEDSEWIEITVSDSGPGIPDEEKERIFTDWYSYGSIDERPGTGLGLGLVRRIVQAHEGEIHETGTFGQGAQFVIHLRRRHQEVCHD